MKPLFRLFLWIPAFLWSLHSGAAVTNSVIVYMPLDGDARNAAREQHQGKGHDLEFTTDRFGKEGKALWLNNPDSFIEIDQSEELHLQNTPFTIIAWMRFNENNPDNAAVAKHLGGSFNGYGIGVTHNKFVFYLNEDPRLMSHKQYNDNQWHMVAAVYDQETMRLYIDGRQDGQKKVQYTNINSSPLYIGACDSSITKAKSGFKGTLDDIFIIEKALSANQILDFFNASKP